MGDYAFQRTISFEMSKLPSLQSIDFGSGCFEGYHEYNYGWIGGTSSFTLIGIDK